MSRVVRRSKALDQCFLAAAVMALWQMLYWLLGDVALASPLQTISRLTELLQNGRFWGDIFETLRAIFAAAFLASAIGISLGVTLAMHGRSGRVAEPMLATLYAIPKVILYPIVLLIFGLGISARIAFGVMHGVIPIALFAMNAIRNISPAVLRSAQVMQLTRLQIATTIIFPAALPGIMTGLRIGISVTLLGVLIGEMFAAKRGLGSRLINAIGLQDLPSILAIALLLSVFALAINAILKMIAAPIQQSR
jgi:NitT/TauT family transport system permease protein